jgi:nicotinamidase-related amidase
VTQSTALLVIDVQCGFDDPAWGARNNLACESTIARLLAIWRVNGWRVIHIHHDSPHPSGYLRSDAAGHAPKPEALPLIGETIYVKRVNSAFIGTTLEEDLRALGVMTLVLVGLTTNHCISTTARMAGNLGFETFVLSDATATFDRATIDGTIRVAEQVHQGALSDLHGEFSQVVTSDWMIAEMTNRDSRHIAA